MFTKEAQALAKPCYEAIKKIAEKAGKKCVQCQGDGVIYLTPLSGESKCFVCNGTGKVKGKWEWKPEVGEFYYHDYGNRRILLIDDEDKAEDIVERNLVERLRIIPLLHWERVEEILEGMGYGLQMYQAYRVEENNTSKDFTATIEIDKDGFLAEQVGKTRQEAVQRAVIELGKGE